MGVTWRNNPDGTLDFLDNSDRVIATVDPLNRKILVPIGSNIDVSAGAAMFTLAAGAISTALLGANVVTTPKLTTTLGTGLIRLPLSGWRKVVTNDIPNLAAIGGVLAKDSDPIFERVNVATDKALRIRWAAASVVEITQNIEIPPDLDDSQPLIVCCRAYMGGSSDTPVIAAGYWQGVGGSNLGGNTGALSNAEQKLTRSIAAPGAYSTEAAITLTPGAHGTDALFLMETWCEYTRK